MNSTASTDRSLPVRMRPGLSVDQSWTRAGRIWVLSDPMVRRYYHLRDEEYELLTLLDGKTSAARLATIFESVDPRRKLNRSRLMALVSRWHREGLVESLAAGQASVLSERSDQERRRRWQRLFGNPLFVRLPGIDPNGLLDRFGNDARWLFSPIFLVAVMTFCFATLIFVFVNFATVASSIPDLQTLTHPRNLGLLLIVTVGVKILHELGHALACRHYGAKPREMGVLLMLGMPCLYCDVSDAWRIPSRWRRLMISGAGIYVELLLAAVATWLWYFSVPGLLNTICLQIMLIGSVNTVLINGNPLLRYDGYYLLSDWIGIVNLGARSQRRLREFLEQIAWGVRKAGDLSDDAFTDRFLLIYAFASTIYRAILMVSILIIVHAVTRPWGLSWVTAIAAVWILWAAVVRPVSQSIRRNFGQVAGRRASGVRSFLSLFAGIAFFVVFFFVPLPSWTTAPTLVRPDGGQDVYVVTGGRLVSIAKLPGDVVRRGELIATLDAASLRRERLSVAGQLRTAEDRVNHLLARGAVDPISRKQVPAAIARRDDWLRQRDQLDQKLESLQLRSPASGILMPTEPIDGPTGSREHTMDELPMWRGQPLDAANLNTFLETGTHVGSVATGQRWRGTVYMSENEVERVSIGQPVWLKMRHAPSKPIAGRVDSISNSEVREIPDVLHPVIALADEVTGQTRSGSERFYQVEITITSGDVPLWINAWGQATVRLSPRSLAEWLRVWVGRTFTF